MEINCNIPQGFPAVDKEMIACFSPPRCTAKPPRFTSVTPCRPFSTSESMAVGFLEPLHENSLPHLFIALEPFFCGCLVHTSDEVEVILIFLESRVHAIPFMPHAFLSQTSYFLLPYLLRLACFETK